MHVGESRSHKDHIHMKAVMMLQFSATKFPFAKCFGLKDFFSYLLETTLSVALLHRVSRSGVLNHSVRLCVCLLMWQNKWVEKDTFAEKKKSILTCDIAVVRYGTLGHLYNMIVLLLNVMSLCR